LVKAAINIVRTLNFPLGSLRQATKRSAKRLAGNEQPTTHGQPFLSSGLALQ